MTVFPAIQRAPSRDREWDDARLLCALQALADPTRLRMMRMLREREQCVCRLTEVLGLAQGTVSHHMRVLKRAGLVTDRKDLADGRWVHYSLDLSASSLGAAISEMLDAGATDPTPAVCSPH